MIRAAIDIVLNRRGGAPMLEQIATQLQLKILGGENDRRLCPRRGPRRPLTGAVILLAAGLVACGSGSTASPTPPASPRTCLMGFTAIPPRPDNALAIRTVDLWATRADAGLLLYDPPWERLLAGDDPAALVRANELGLANYYCGKGLRIVASIDATNGLDRAADSSGLQAVGRSLTEPVVRDAYVRYVGAFAAGIRPEYLSVASETNLRPYRP